MVGIGGGVPSKNTDIQLGDIIVSQRTTTSPGVIQYDNPWIVHNRQTQWTRSLNEPPLVLYEAVLK